MSSHDSDANARLEAVIAAFLEAVERGESPDRAALLQAHPDLADALRAFFADHDQMQALAQPLRDANEAGPRPFDALTVSFGPAAGAPPGAGTHVRYVGDYELIDEIAAGGMGVVYRARQISLDRPVAVKMILAGMRASAEAVRRFRQEAEAAAKLDHPHIVPIYEVGEHEGLPYFSMRLVEGCDLATLLTRDDRPTRRMLVALLATVARPVGHAHARGVLHRDLKPRNILVDGGGAPHVSDFGLARRLESDSDLTTADATPGTPSYMAPEQARGERRLTLAVDVYGLGAVLYEILTGRPPHRADTPAATVQLVRDAEPAPPRVIDPSIDRDLETITLKCLEKDAARRYASAEAVADELDRWARGEPIQARPVGRVEKGWRWCRRNKLVAGLAAIVVGTFLVGSATSAVLGARASANAQRADRYAQAARAEALRATQSARKAIEEKHFSERLRYDAEMAAAFSDYRSGNTEVARRRLRYVVPKNGSDADFRGFEWHYLNGLLNQESRVIQASQTWVNAVAFSPDGLRIATADACNALRIWDVASGKELSKILRPKPSTDSYYIQGGICFSRDGRCFAAHEGTEALRIYESLSARELTELKWEKGRATRVSFSPTDDRVAIGIADGTVRIWDLNSRRELLALGGLKSAVSDVQFSPDGKKLLATAGDDLSARSLNCRVWDSVTGKVLVSSGAELAALSRPREWAWSSPSRGSFSPNGQQIALTRGDKSVRLVSALTGHEDLALVGHESTPTAAAFSPSGEVVASAGLDGSIRIWDAETGTQLSVRCGHAGAVTDMAYSPDGRWLASVGHDGTLRFWDTDSVAETTRAEHDEFQLFFKNGELFALCTDSDAFLYCKNIGSSETHKSDIRTYGARRTYKSQDSRRVAVLFEDSVLKVWDLELTPAASLVLNSRANLSDLDFSADSRRIASGGSDGTLWVWDTTSGDRLAAFHAGPKLTSVAFAPDSQRVGSGHVDGSVRLWDVPKKSQTSVIRLASLPVTRMHFSPDGLRLEFRTFRGLVDGAKRADLRVQFRYPERC